jgi:hypothetical protein
VTRLALAVLCALLLLPAGAAAQELKVPERQDQTPRDFTRTAAEIKRIANATDAARREAEEGPMSATAYIKGPGRWQVSFFRDGDEVAQIHVDDRTGGVIEEWDDHQVPWTMARGYEGAFGRKVNAPYVWIPLCILFVAPFVSLRRPLRLLHLDLLVLVGLMGLSHWFFNRGEIDVSVPLVYPVLLYLVVRLLLVGLRRRDRGDPLVPHVPIAWLAVGLVFLVTFRIGINIADSNVIDVGYAGVIGADRIVDGKGIYGEGFHEQVQHGDTYGPLTYVLYVPFEQTMWWSGRWDDLPAAHGAAMFFDLLAIGALFLAGRRMRPGAEGNALGLAFAYAWAANPYTAFALMTNSNDSLVGVTCAIAVIALTVAGPRAGPLARGAAMALAGGAKFAPLALAPLFARSGRGRDFRELPWYALGLALVLAALVLPFMPDGGPREIYDRTVGYQAARGSPFSIWGLWEIEGAQSVAKIGAVALALLLFLVPWRRDVRQTAALGGAVLIALQLTVTHWFYLYVVWFLPFVLVGTMAAYSTRPAPEPAREREAVAAG